MESSMPVPCAVCGKNIRLFKIRIKDGFICGPCQNRLPMNDYNRKEELTSQEIREIIRLGEERDNSKPDLFQAAVSKLSNSGDSRFDQVREFKRLLDEGIISEEEYEAKRKELLGLER